MDFLQIGLGGGCHWCTESVFLHLRGVIKVQQGWISSVEPYENDSEAILVEFDQDIIPLSIIVEIHLRTHSSASDHGLRNKYRSAFYVLENNDYLSHVDKITGIMNNIAKLEERSYVTQVLPMKAFTLNQEKYLDYYRKYYGNQFCERYIDPKLEVLRENYANYSIWQNHVNCKKNMPR